MIATLAFDPPRDGVRRARFVPWPNVPVDAACVVANGVREALRTLLGDTASVALGEPVAIDAAAWQRLVRDALLFLAPGRATDVVFVIAAADARRLVHAAFGEEHAAGAGAWSALEAGAIERIVARCAAACDALCVERRGPTHAVDSTHVAPPVAYFDVRVTAPIAFTLGVGIVRALPVPAPRGALAPATLAEVPLELRIVLGTGSLPVPQLLELRVGSVVALATKVAGEGELKLAGQMIASGTCGVRNRRTAFQVRSATMRGVAW